MIRNAGCDFSKVTLVPSSAEETIARLENGEVVAAATLDPLTARTLRGENKLVANLDAELCPKYGVCPLSIAVVDVDWATQNPELVEGFERAMHEAISWIQVNDIDFRAELVRCCSVDVDDATESDIPNFVGLGRSLDLDMQRLQSIVSSQLDERSEISDNEQDAGTNDADAQGS